MSIDKRLKNKFVDDLFDAISLLKNRKECYQFFEDICTVGEIRAMAQRFAVAKKLDGGEIYSDIVQETGASTATISRVKRCLNYGADGYKLIIERLKK
ncbi:YerC/YecD family TrpR-related protein [Candidatus Oleimmundimicrobium sp.]|uniref:YerC/YecD family TrpR-related protein n=1 Tax=Candidatus Oleimmundimicrobium sp. TaxID=3060597 RepID=UPI002726DB87|nr:YerC/YecD family TrpR-related protein [Candidatus Oleimmundimicrobium sp.]MDO8886628.1 YerC/YecD family TrpR-related protein [Candidatus Oleimmundimicrobium sp.]